MLTKDLLRVSRAGEDYRPQFVAVDHRDLAARTVGVFQGHVGEPRAKLSTALSDLERASPDFKLVRGFASLLERDATFETHTPLSPGRVRRATFETAATVGVVTRQDRQRTLAETADRLGTTPDAVEDSLYADRESEQIMTAFEPRWSPSELLDQYDLSLAQTALFDATAVRIRSSDPRTLVSTVKRLGLLYEVDKDDGDWELHVTGPDALFASTRRYGRRFARLLRSVATTAEWHLEATIDDHGTERLLTLSEAEVSVPGVDPVTDVSFDSEVEADFARRFESLDLPWDLTREPEPLEAGASVAIPDFALDYQYADFRVYVEIMGFWTPDYVAKKLDQFEAIDDVELLVAVEESLDVGEDIEARDHRAIPYTDRVRVRDVRSALRRYEADLVTDAAASLPAELEPEADVITLDTLADEYDVSPNAIEQVTVPSHERVGRTLLRPRILKALADDIESGMDVAAVDAVLDEYGIDDASTVLSRLGYHVEWDRLGEGVVRRRED
ncbi:MAG: DUF790 family protein [Halorhabdus sp.]